MGHPALPRLLGDVGKPARSVSAVLVPGESGTGKEPIAHGIHRLSGSRGSFVPINCSALPREIIESELFGHVSGAFSGVTREKPGLSEMCEGGRLAGLGFGVGDPVPIGMWGVSTGRDQPEPLTRVSAYAFSYVPRRACHCATPCGCRATGWDAPGTAPSIPQLSRRTSWQLDR
jgi:hypothetical protein